MKKIIKIISVIVAIILLIGMIFFADAFVGNPISKYLVDKNSNKYIEENYAELDLDKEIGYSFKTTNYFVYLKSKTIKDLYFTLSYNKLGKLKYDGYENRIVKGWNIITRLDEDYREKTDKTFDKLKNTPLFATNKSINTFSYLFSKGDIPGIDGGIDGSSLELDKEYDVKEIGKIGGIIKVYVSFSDGDESYERGAEALKIIKKVFDEDKLGFCYINFAIYNKEGNYAYIIDYFPYSEIDSENLAEKVKIAHETNPNYHDK